MTRKSSLPVEYEGGASGAKLRGLPHTRATSGAPSLDRGDGRVYAVNGKGQFMPGWPITPNAQLPGILPFVGPGVDHALGDLNGDGSLEVIGFLRSGGSRRCADA